jgi:hypothetical protein
MLLDLGTGFCTFLATIAQLEAHIECIGVEVNKMRCYMMAVQLASLWDSADGDKVLNHDLQMIYGNIEHLNDIGHATILYTLDEAFPLHIWNKLVNMFLDSPTCEYLVTFKAVKIMEGWNDRKRFLLQHCKLIMHYQLHNKTSGKSQCLDVKKCMFPRATCNLGHAGSSIWPSPMTDKRGDSIKHHES